MEETTQMVMNYGFFGAFMIIFLYIGLKYIPKVIDMWLEKSKKRDYRDDILMKTIENNSRVIENNTMIIQLNTDNRHKLEEQVCRLNETLFRHDTRAEEIAQDVKILKERK